METPARAGPALENEVRSGYRPDGRTAQLWPAAGPPLQILPRLLDPQLVTQHSLERDDT